MAGVAELAEGLVAGLDPEQRAAALLPDGPAQIIAPAGSGKTTTLIARLGVLLARGVAPERIGVVTFNRDAAAELTERIARRLAPTVPDTTRIEVRTLHAMARQVLLDASEPVELLRDRLPLLRAIRRRALERAPDEEGAPGDQLEPPEPAALDTAISAWKVEGREISPAGRPLADEYVRRLSARGQIDFDDLLVRALERLDADPALRRRWRSRFAHLLVDEFQDVDAAQLRLVRELAEPERNLFVVGDDDQTIYAWRLADVRRILGFGDAYPGARRIQLATNYRCPPAVIEVAARLVAVNRERFTKRIEPPPDRREADDGAIAAVSTRATGWEAALVRWAAAGAQAGETFCFLARTRGELLPILLALVRAGVPHRTTVTGPLDAERVRDLLAAAADLPPRAPPFAELLRLRVTRGWRRADANDEIGDEEHAALDALLGWAAGFGELGIFLAAAAAMARRVAALRRPDAGVELVTVHGAKGREWQTVVVLGMEEDRMPNRRSLAEATDPARALEEERRLAYVAVTRATRRLVLAVNPDRPSPFLGEMGLLPRARPRGQPR